MKVDHIFKNLGIQLDLVQEEVTEQQTEFLSSVLSIENIERLERLEVKYEFDATRQGTDSRLVSRVLLDYIRDYSEVAWWQK